MIKTVLNIVCDIIIFLNIMMAALTWYNNHDDIMNWLFYLINAVIFTILSVRYDKD